MVRDFSRPFAGTLKRAIRADRYRIVINVLTEATTSRQADLINDLNFHPEYIGGSTASHPTS